MADLPRFYCSMKVLTITLLIAATFSTLTCLPLKDSTMKLLRRGNEGGLHLFCISESLVFASKFEQKTDIFSFYVDLWVISGK